PHRCGRGRLHPSKITVALPGTDRPTAPRQPQSPPRITAVGSLTARKGHDVLLAALAQLQDLDWTAQIVGGPHDPDVAQALHAQCLALGLSARVTFVGEVDEAGLHAAYANTSIFALATRYEGYGMVFAEAIAHGLPIVTCLTGAVPDTVPADAGLLVAPDDPTAFADALRLLLTEPGIAKSLADAATRAAERLPTWQDTIRLVVTALEKTAQ
ncbi:MAG: glycosyltransferase family 4 protein, partial [Alphaproteobacteria bacterium]